MIIYKDIMGKLANSGYTTYRLRKEKILSESTIQRIRSGSPLNTKILDRICFLTGSKIQDLIEYVPDKK